MPNWPDIKNKIRNAIKQIQNNPITDEVVKLALGSIPSPAGSLLLSIYENSKESPEDKGEQILQLLKHYEFQNEQNLEKQFKKLEENKTEILQNQNYLRTLLEEATKIQQQVQDTREEMKLEFLKTQNIVADQQKVVLELVKINRELKEEISLLRTEQQKVIVQTNQEKQLFDINSKKDTLQFYKKLKTYLDNAFHLFKVQAKKRNELIYNLSASHEVKNYKYFEDMFSGLYDKLNDEELKMFNYVRNMTSSIYEYNSRVQRLLDDNFNYLDEMELLEKLHEHLYYWINKYRKFQKSSDMCLVYVGPKEGKGFPVGLDSKIKSKIDELESQQ